jgi:RNA polymerase sigma factor (sigma-70 family)
LRSPGSSVSSSRISQTRPLGRCSSVVSSAHVTVPPFQDFLDANRAIVYRFLVAAVGPGEVDDCFQETFLAALRAYPRLGHGERLDRWILRIASRKAIDHHRMRAGRVVLSDDLPDVAGPGEPFAADPALWKAVGSLPPKQRIAVVHRHVLDRPYAEIAELMGTTEEAARANVSAGVKRLRELIA